MTLAITLLVPMLSPVIVASAAETESVWTLEVGENAYYECEETDTIRTVTYYKNGVALRKAEYNLDTGVILSYDLNRNTRNTLLQNIDESEKNVVTYHISDFKKTTNNKDERFATNGLNELGSVNYNINSRGSIYSYLKSKILVFDGEEYVRMLYGRTGYREYLEDYWYFEAGVTIDVVLVAIGFFVPELIPILKKISTAADILLIAIAIEDWIGEYYWEYKFIQSIPIRIEFECPYRFPYLKYRRMETSEGSAGGWDYENPVYEKSSAEIEVERDNILTSPVLYQ